MTPPPAQRYRSAVDTWLLILLGGGILVAGASCGIVLVVGDAPARAIAAVTGAIGIGLPLWVLTTTSYTLTAEHLLVRCGPLRKQLPISDIMEVTPTSNPLSAPALSLDRLRIATARHGAVMISPADRSGFIADLEAKRAAAAARTPVGTAGPGQSSPV
jgi:hypothetical protein